MVISPLRKEAINKAAVFFLIFKKKTLENPQILEELMYAKKIKKPLIIGFEKGLKPKIKNKILKNGVIFMSFTWKTEVEQLNKSLEAFKKFGEMSNGIR